MTTSVTSMSHLSSTPLRAPAGCHDVACCAGLGEQVAHDLLVVDDEDALATSETCVVSRGLGRRADRHRRDDITAAAGAVRTAMLPGSARCRRRSRGRAPSPPISFVVKKGRRSAPWSRPCRRAAVGDSSTTAPPSFRVETRRPRPLIASRALTARQRHLVDSLRRFRRAQRPARDRARRERPRRSSGAASTRSRAPTRSD